MSEVSDAKMVLINPGPALMARLAGSEPHAKPLRGRLGGDQMSNASRARPSCSGAGSDRRQLSSLVMGIGNSNLRRSERPFESPDSFANHFR
jgi:hypothetical protein